MTPLLLYLLKANLALILFYAGYYGWLRKLTFYSLNRCYLLFAIVFAAVFPFFHPEKWFTQTPDIPVSLGTVLVELNSSPVRNSGPDLSQWLSYGIGCGIICFGILLIIKLIGIGRIHFNSVPSSWSVYPFRKSDEGISPFAFWKNIYLNPALHPTHEFEKIFKHEYIHVQKLHSLDILMAELVRVFFWYNPVVWLLGKSIRENIEFMTDDAVLNSGIDRKSYQYSLLQSIRFSQSNTLIGNHFNLNNLKTRIMMMNKQRSSGRQLGKYVLLVPAVMIGSLIFTITKANDTQAETKITAVSITTSPIPADTTKPVKVQPLMIIDGVKTDKKSIDQLDPEVIKSVSVIKDKSAVETYGAEAAGGVIQITTKSKEEMAKEIKPVKKSETVSKINIREKQEGAISGINIQSANDSSAITIRGHKNGEIPDAVFYVNGEKYEKEKMKQLNPNVIRSVTVLKGQHALDKYGEEGKNGVIEINLKED